MGRPTGDLVGIPSLGIVVTTAEGNSEFEVFDANTLEPAPGSPYTTGNGAVAVVSINVAESVLGGMDDDAVPCRSAEVK